MSSRSVSDAQTSAGSDFALDEPEIASAYQAHSGVYHALREEIEFILKDRIATHSVKIHAIESRVKTLPSIVEKCVRKATNDPFSDFVDIAAARVVCLFRSDIDRLKDIVVENFEVISTDDKITEGGDALDYMSVHMICRMKPGFSGPRYERIIGKPFEIQLRTLCMHCWATVSHYVDYKGDWDVPANLKMALSALSGLFYVADSEFENFNTAMVASRKSAEKATASERQSQDINLDTVTAMIRSVFPERKSAAADKISGLVQEIKAAGYRSLEQLQTDLDAGARKLGSIDARAGGRLYYSDLGAARKALAAVSERFAEVRDEKMARMHIKT